MDQARHPTDKSSRVDEPDASERNNAHDGDRASQGDGLGAPNGLLGRALSAIDRSPLMTVGAVVLLGLIARGLVLRWPSGDMLDWYIPWYEAIAKDGFHALSGPLENRFGHTYGNYAPTFYYLLWLVSRLDGWLPTVVLIKLTSLPFEILATFTAVGVVRALGFGPQGQVGAALAVFIAPVTIANGWYWGQTDMMYGSLVLLAVWAAVLNRPLGVTLAAGLALSFKAQALLFFPALFALLLRGRLKLWHFATIPAVYAVMMVPAWLAGRPAFELLTVYGQQFGLFHALNANAPNFWVDVPDRYYEQGVWIGIGVTAVACLALSLWVWRKKLPVTPQNIVLLCALFSALTPFLLPKMHDRYLFHANLVSLLLLFSHPTSILPVLGLQLASLFGYLASIRMDFVPMGEQGVAPLLNVGALLVLAFLVHLGRTLYVEATQPAARRPGDRGESTTESSPPPHLLGIA